MLYTDNVFLQRRITNTAITYNRASWIVHTNHGLWRKVGNKLFVDLSQSALVALDDYVNRSMSASQLHPTYIKSIYAATTKNPQGFIISVPVLAMDDEGFSLADTVHEALHHPLNHLGIGDMVRAVGAKPKLKAEISKIAFQTLKIFEKATRFNLDMAAYYYIKEVSHRPPAEMLKLMEVARLPFEKVWLEWTFPYQGSNFHWDSPDRIGLLCMTPFPDQFPGFIKAVAFSAFYGDNYAAYSQMENHLCGNQYLGTLGLTQDTVDIMKHIDMPKDLPAELPIWFYIGMEAFNPGYFAIHHLVGTNMTVADTEQVQDIVRRVRLAPSPVWVPIIKAAIKDDSFSIDKLLKMSIEEARGDTRLLATFLGTLYASPLNIGEVERRAGPPKMILGKVAPYLEHRKVSLKVPRQEHDRELDVFFRGGGVPRRAHMVRTHRCTSHKYGNPLCPHPEILRPTPNLEVCAACGAKWWWRKAHQRGDASIGFVTKSYEVEATL